MIRNVRMGALVLAGAVLLSGCAGGGPSGEPSGDSATGGILLVTLEHWWDPEVPDDPFAGPAWAGFTRHPDAMTPCPQARPAIASMLTGRTPDVLGVWTDADGELPADAPYVPQRLAEAGWETAAFVANPKLARAGDLRRGFELYDAPNPLLLGLTRVNPPMRPAEEVLANYRSWAAARDRGRPAFAWVHLTGRWEPPVKRSESEPPPAAPEGGEVDVEFVYRSPLPALESLLISAEPGTIPERVIVVGVAGRVHPGSAERAGYVLAPEILRVPFLVGGGAEVPAEPYWLPQLASTILRAAAQEPGADTGAPADGVRLAWTWRGARELGWYPATAAVAGNVALFRDGGPRDVRAVDWASGETWPGQVDPSLNDVLQRKAAPDTQRHSPEIELPPELRAELERLEALPPARAPLQVSPRDAQLRSLEHLLEARRLILAQERERALEAFREAIRTDPANLAAVLEIGETFVPTRPRKRAKRRLEQALAMDPFHPEVWHQNGHVAYAVGEFELAEARWRVTEILRPGPDVLYDLACMRSIDQDAEGAIGYLRRAWDAGFRQVDYIQRDPDLRHLRADARFGEFMAEVVR